MDNLIITVRERGKIVTRREGHNIWLNTGRQFLAELLSYNSYGPDVTQIDDRPQFIGFGIGGARQNAVSVANTAPCITNYPGTNQNLDIDPRYTSLERPARISFSTGPVLPTGTYPNLTYDAGDVWLKQLTVASHPTPFSIQWGCSFVTTDFSNGPFLVVPLSEIGLFLSSASTNVYNNSPVAYDTFDTISKTANYSFDVSWTVRV